MLQHRASTVPMLTASAQYRPGAGTQWYVYSVDHKVGTLINSKVE